MAAAASSALLLCTFATLSSAYVLVHQPPVVYTSGNPPPAVPVDRPPLVAVPGGQPPVIYHYGLGGVRPQLQPPVVLVRLVPVLPPQLPPQQPPFIEEVTPVLKNPPSPDAGAAKPPAKKPSSRRGGHGANCPEVDNKKGIAPPPTRKPFKRGRDAQARKSRRPPELTTRRPPGKTNRRVDPKSERLRSERLTEGQNA
uniref:Hypothetical secreted proline-rich protein n=1 Tax=Amblyomma variegatum TaxID=34610 RepID=F0JA55_AMBVA|nr:TPA_inf: hypothetical secreted proline-rich protein [Amblyomma variegatum]